MKKIIYFLLPALMAFSTSHAQVLPSFQFGAKAGFNLTDFSRSSSYNSNNRTGYLGGFWARIGAAGFNFQPEIYLTSKDVDINSNGVENKARFNSLDVPLLFGNKIGAFGVGVRFYTGPDLSFAINNSQNFSAAAHDAVRLDYKDQNLAWQFGAGLDIKKLSFDIRYEAGLSSQNFEQNPDIKTKINLVQFSVGYSLFGL